MPTTTTAFFATEQNGAAIRNFSAVVRTLPPLEPPNPDVTEPLKVFFSIFSENLEAFDQHCTANIEWLGKRYIGQLISFVEQRGEKASELLIDIFITSYRFLCELEFSQPGDLSFELRGIKHFVSENLEQFQGTQKQQLIYANYVMPANVAKRLIHDSSLADFKEFASSASAARTLKEEWDKEIAEKKSEIDGLRKSIERVKTQYNFVGLVSGFETLVKQKKNESASAFKALVILGVVMLIPVTVQLAFVLNNIKDIEAHRTTLLYSLPTLLALEVILLYFFRVVLSSYRGLQTQLLQLDLRVSLCQFIQSYSEYSTKIKKNDPTALDRFEALVFSGITSDGDNIPATFDGIEQISKLVKSVRGQ